MLRGRRGGRFVSDVIDELVDWQLSQRRGADVVRQVCRVCLTMWCGDDVQVCPLCGITQ